MTIRVFRSVTSLGALAAMVACSRYEYRTPHCPPLLPARDSVRITAGAPSRLTGAVVDGYGRGPVPTAAVVLKPTNRAAYTGADGTFGFDTVRPGTYRVELRHIGYRVRRIDSVRVGPGAGVALHMWLEMNATDGCGEFAMERVRKPWWNLW